MFSTSRRNARGSPDTGEPISTYGTIQDEAQLWHRLESANLDLRHLPSDEPLGRKPAKESSSGPEKHKRAAPLGNYLRYAVVLVTLMGVLVHTYINNTFYIAAIEMISGDVLDKGMTELRAEHISQDPLAVARNAASPGTCPVSVQLDDSLQELLVVDTIGGVAVNGTAARQTNLTQLSLDKRLALDRDARLLLSQIDQRIAAGNLVNWTINQRSLLFSTDNIGGILLGIPMTQLGLKVGNRLTMTIMLVAITLRALLTPLMVAHCNYWIVFVFETFTSGLGHSTGMFIFPVAASWLLAAEANVAVSLIGLTSILGSTLASFLSTQLLSNGIEWPWCFYLPGLLGAITTLAWVLVAADEPETSKIISQHELQLLNEGSLAKVRQRAGLEEMRSLAGHHECICDDPTCPARRRERKPNWRAILSCPSIWAIVGCILAVQWNYKLTSMWPSFFANIVHMDTATIGFLTGSRAVIALSCGLTIAIFTRKFPVQRPFGISLTAYRKACITLATTILLVSSTLMMTMDCSVLAQTISVLLTPLSSALDSVCLGQMIFDLAPRESGLLNSFTRTVSSADVIALPVVGYILSFADDSVLGSRSTWRVVWLSSLLLKVCATAAFLLVAKSESVRSYSYAIPAGKCRALQRRQ